MTEIPATPPHDATIEDLDAWRDDIALITPSGPGQWLPLPIVYVAMGVLALIGLLLIAHGRTLSPQSWVLIGAAGIFVVWGFAFAWFGRRAYVLYDLQESQRYVKLKVAGACGLCVLATAAGVISGSVLVAMAGFIVLWMMWSQRRVAANALRASDFRVALSDIVRTAFLVEGIVMAATSLAGGLFALLVINNGSRVVSAYVGGGAAIFVVGCLTTVMTVRSIRATAAHRRAIESIGH